MKTKSTLTFFAFISILLFSACFSPKPVVRVETASNPDKWNYGQAILEAEKDGIVASAAYAYHDRDYLVFDVEVTNWREESIFVDPARISLSVMPQDLLIPAIDPETQLLNMDMDASRREASAKNMAVVAGVVTVAAVTAAVASGSDNNDGDAAVNNYDNDVVNVAPTLIVGGGGAAPSGQRIAEDAWFWADQTLRKTTLENGQKVRGKVIFERDDQVRDFEMNIAVEELLFTFGFKQRLFRP